RELAVAIDQEREGGVAVLLAEIAEDLREIRGVLFVEQVDEIRRRAEANQALHRIEYDINLALRHRDPPNLPRDWADLEGGKGSVLSAGCSMLVLHAADAGLPHGVVGGHDEQGTV